MAKKLRFRNSCGMYECTAPIEKNVGGGLCWEYCVDEMNESDIEAGDEKWGAFFNDELITTCKTIKEAKKFCQKHYDDAIKNA